MPSDRPAARSDARCNRRRGCFRRRPSVRQRPSPLLAVLVAPLGARGIAAVTRVRRAIGFPKLLHLFGRADLVVVVVLLVGHRDLLPLRGSAARTTLARRATSAAPSRG